jgi:hypothetical protein
MDFHFQLIFCSKKEPWNLFWVDPWNSTQLSAKCKHDDRTRRRLITRLKLFYLLNHSASMFLRILSPIPFNDFIDKILVK